MSRLIDADQSAAVLARIAEKKLNCNCGGHVYREGQALMYAKAVVEKMPTVEAVPVVRCKDCKYRNTENGFCEGRGWPMQLVPDDGFCNYAERKEE